MRFARLGEPGAEQAVVLADHGAFALPGEDIDATFWSSGGVQRAAQAIKAGMLSPLEGWENLRVGPPIARPGAVICVGMNYAAHAAESGSEPPTTPIVFLKTPNTVVGPNDDIPLPPGSITTDWEVELGVVIGSAALYVSSPEAAAAHIAGYVLVNDVSERTFQMEHSGGQWSKGKCAPHFTPAGPWLVTPDECEPTGLNLRSWVNGEPRQDSVTADMIFDVNYLVWHLSQYMELEPGDLLLTGTPQGVALSGRFPYLKVGDLVETEITGLGKQRQRVTETNLSAAKTGGE